MEKIEEAKKILDKHIQASSFDSRDTKIWGKDEAAKEINQLYEPHPNQCSECGGTGKDYRDGGFDGDFADCPKCKPDQSSRLLTDDEIKDAKVGHVAILVHGKPEVRDSDWEVAKAQLAKDEARIEALISKILGKMNKRDVGGEKPEWGLSDKDYQELKANPTSEVEG